LKEPIILEFYKDFPDAALHELNAIRDTFGTIDLMEIHFPFALVMSKGRDFQRLTYLKEASVVIAESEKYEGFSSTQLPEGKYYIRIKDPMKCHGTSDEPLLGNILNSIGRVDFRSPDFVVNAFHLSKWYLTRRTYSNSNATYNERRAPLRPFFSPVSLHPRIARLMVNLARVKPGDTLFDPFCGTGGILIEAGKIGLKVVGNDISLQMFSGAKLNLKYFGIRDAVFFNSDFTKLNASFKADAIVTDLPYGRNSHLSAVNIKDLYSRTFGRFPQFLKRGNYAVFMINDTSYLELLHPDMSVRETLSMRVHKSLTRHIIVSRYE